MEVKLHKLCYIVLGTIVYLLTSGGCKSLSLIKIPKLAKPGFIATFVRAPGEISQQTEPWIRALFSVRDDGALVVRRPVGHLSGQTVRLVIHHPAERDQHQTHIHLHFSEENVKQTQYFNGFVYSDQEAGSTVKGLDDLYSQFDKTNPSYYSLEKENGVYMLGFANGLLRLVLKESVEHFTKAAYTVTLRVSDNVNRSPHYISVDITSRNRNNVWTEQPIVSKPVVETVLNKNHLSIFENTIEKIIHQRMKRAVLSERTFVVRRNKTGELFTIKKDISDTTAKCYFQDPAPSMLTIDENSCMVSLKNGEEWNTTTKEMRFTVNVTTSSGQEKGEALISLLFGQYSPGRHKYRPLVLFVCSSALVKWNCVLMSLGLRQNAYVNPGVHIGC